MVKFKVIRLCKQEALSIAPTEMLRYDLVKAGDLLRSKGFEVRSQGPMIVASSEGFEATFYPNGRMLISKVDTKERATEIANRIYEAVEGSLEPLPLRRT